MLSAAPPPAVHAPAPVRTLRLDLRKPVTTFRPDRAFGAAFDGGDAGESRPLLAAANGPALRSAGLMRGTYRLRTELAIEAWHWSAHGRWSDPAHARGYWTGDPDRDDPSPVSWGYRLPRRGDTLDEANNDGFSRLDDGDARTFWKSDPYLDGRHTGIAGERAEWIKVDLGAETPVDAAEIAWAGPYAVRLRVQHWVGETPWSGRWVDFPTGRVEDGRGGVQRLRLAPAPLPVRYVRFELLRSSHTAEPGTSDPRDALGYAAAELRVGRLASGGRLVDAVRHAPDNRRQTLVYVSSTDPWHRAEDRDPHVEQPSPLALVSAGLIGRGPMMLPTGLLYDTPENALAEVAYFRRRGLPFTEVELGEEPDGQRVFPADYAALYAPLARAIRARWPDLVVGGPSLVNGRADLWLEDGADQSWTSRLMKALAALDARDLLGFFSFEFYPFEEFCTPASAKLLAEPGLFDTLAARLRADGVPASTPLVITEFGLSAFASVMEVQPMSALWTAQTAVEWLLHGGATAYLFGFAPNRPMSEAKPCAGRGNMMLWLADNADRARWPLAAYHGWRLATGEWAQPGGGAHTLFPAATAGAVAAYPLRRPDGRLSVLLLNRGDAPATVRLDGAGEGAPEVLAYGPDRYRWSVKLGRPIRTLPPTRGLLAAWDAPLTLPAMSMAVVRER